MRRKMEEMKNIVRKIEMKPNAQEEMLANLNTYAEQLASQPPRRYTGLRRAAVIVGAIGMLGLASVPVKAFVQSLLQERMEQVPKEELETIFAEKQEQEVNADGFSRAFNEKENERMTALALEYRMGHFPEKEILRVEKQEQIVKDTLCYVTENSFYSLPERDLTDEEMLQYLDFQEKMRYALEEEMEEALQEERKEAEKTEQEAIAEIKEAGGIDELEANQVGAYWLKTLYGKDTTGLENNYYLYTDDMPMPAQETLKYSCLYMSYYGVIHDNYYFYVDAVTGKLAEMSHTYARREADDLSQSEAEDLLEENRKEAECILREKFGNGEKVRCVYSSYIMEKDGMIKGGIVSFHFVTEDGNDYILSMNGKRKELVGYLDTDFEAYMELMKQEEKKNKERSENEKYPERERVMKKIH